MKKIFSFAMGLLAMTTLQAANTEVARLTLTGQGGTESSNVTLRVDPAVSTAQTTSFFGATDEIGQVNIYAIEGTATYSAYKKDNLSKLELQIITNRRDAADQHYTLTFNVPTLTDGLTLFDRATGTATPITHNGTYEFDVNTTLHPDFVAGTNYTVKERFYINYVAPAYVIMNGDFADPGNAWAYTSNFTNNGTSFSLDLDLAADTWYHFQLEEGYATAYIAADGSSFDRDNNSHNLPVDGWHSALLLYADVAGTYTFTWYDLTDNLTITFPTPSYAAEVTTNAEGLATFSFGSDLQAVEGGVKLYKGANGGDELTLTQVDYVKANEGVIVYGEPNTTYHFNAETGSSDFSGNELKAASTWEYPHAGKDVFVLSGNMLYLYEGETMKPNKAFLQLVHSGNAPRHIRLVFSQATDVENTQAEVKAVKFVGEDGQILIQRGEEVYNLQGQIVK